jgi:diacylglycerol kinase (ATP)
MQPLSSAAPPLVLLNPAANRGRMEAWRQVIRPRAEAEGAEYYETRQRGDARDRARAAAATGRAVVIVGGDGSINEVVNGLLAVEPRVPLGIVPAGSGNDFACNTLGLPRDVAHAFEIALHGTPVAVDAGRANERYFANSFSVGIDADVALAAEGLKRYPFMRGSTLYYASSLQRLFFGYRRCPWLRIALDGQPLAEDQPVRHVILAITNGPTYGGGFRVNPTANHTDGQFDICSVRHMPRMRALNLLPRMQKGQHPGEPEVTFYHAQMVRILCPDGVNAQMDGETLRAADYTVQIVPQGLLVRVGANG